MKDFSFLDDLLPSKGSLLLNCIYDVELSDKDGRLKWKDTFHNDVVTVGKNKLFDVGFRNQTQITAWYFGLVDNSGFTAFAAADTISSHTGWNEFTSYSDSTRIAWSPDAAASGSITNSTAATFSINGSGTLKGLFLVSENTKGGTSGTLWGTAAFSTTQPVSNGDSFKVTYTISA